MGRTILRTKPLRRKPPKREPGRRGPLAAEAPQVDHLRHRNRDLCLPCLPPQCRRRRSRRSYHRRPSATNACAPGIRATLPIQSAAREAPHAAAPHSVAARTGRAGAAPGRAVRRARRAARSRGVVSVRELRRPASRGLPRAGAAARASAGAACRSTTSACCRRRWRTAAAPPRSAPTCTGTISAAALHLVHRRASAAASPMRSCATARWSPAASRSPAPASARRR